MKSVKTNNQAKRQETAKETDIDQINKILKSWPKERISFLAESLKHPPGVLQEAKEQAEPEESDSEDPGDVAESMVKQWLLNQDYTTKLAFTILYGYHIGDHGTEKLANEISSQYEAEIMAKAKNPDSSLSSTEAHMTGVVAELLVWKKNM